MAKKQKIDEEKSEIKVKVSNDQIAEYLEYYIGLKSPPYYAVLLNGAWGSGKTWFINSLRNKIGYDKFLYVTLYGVTSFAEIEDQFFRQLHPVLSSKPFTLGAKLFKAVLKGTLKLDFESNDSSGGIDFEIPKLNAKQFLEKCENRILIFDDFERCEMKPEEVLGYINTFVEHDGQKVIILAHEQEIKSSDKYLRTNEKLIGRRFRVNADAKNALTAFIDEVSDDAVKSVLKANSEIILEVSEKADSENLRSLRHGVIEYQKLFSLLPDKAKEHAEFQRSCIRTFFILAIAIRSGKIAPSDIEGLAKNYYKQLVKKSLDEKKSGKKEEPTPEQVYFNKLSESLLSNPAQSISPNEIFWYYFFEHGTIPADVVKEAIEGSVYFQDENTPTWMRLLHVWSLTDEEFQKYFNEVKTDFSDLKFTEQGVIKHIVGVFLFLAKNKLVDMSYQKMLTFLNGVVGQLEKQNLIAVLSPKEAAFYRLDNAYGGFGFFDSDSADFKKFVVRIADYQKRRTVEDVKVEAPNLLKLMETDSSEFLAKMTVSRFSITSIYAEKPVLNHLSQDEFLDVFIRMEPDGRTNVGYVFKERYNFTQSYPTLLEELPWMVKLKSRIKVRLRGLKQPTKFHLQQFEKNALTPAILQLREFSKNLEKATQT